MKSHFRPKMSPTTGLLRVPGRELPFTLKDLRAWLIACSGDPLGLDADKLIWSCAYCTRLLPLDNVELDHVEPVKRGGNLGLSNLAIACTICNREKGEMTAEEYRALIRGLDTFPQAARNYIRKCLRTAAMGARMRFHPRDQKGEIEE
ncbi:MAG: HNH endonuclease [Acidobacteriaceae bacterium]